MKRLLLGGTAFLGLAASGSVACATPFDFTYTHSLVDFTVPTTDIYQILAFGAQGAVPALAAPMAMSSALGVEVRRSAVTSASRQAR